jgi:hypothetical protein
LFVPEISGLLVNTALIPANLVFWQSTVIAKPHLFRFIADLFEAVWAVC